MDAGGAQKRKAAASTSLRKKPRRSGRDKSEFVSVEVGMREFKKRLAASGEGDAAASSTNAVEDLTQDVKAAKARAKPKAAAKTVVTTTNAAAARKTEAPRTTIKKATTAKRPAGETKKVTKAPIKKTPAAARKTTPARKPTAPRTTRAASKMTLAEVKAQLEREQKERIEYRIQTLHREAKPTAATSSSAPATAVTTASAPEIAVHVAVAPLTAAPAVLTPAASPVHREAMLVAGAVPRQNIGGPPVPNSAASVASEKHVLGTQAYTPTAPPTAQIPFSAAPAASSAPLSSPAKNEFIVDDMDEDLMFAMALEEVERKLATPQKLPPSSEAVAATSDPFSLPSVQEEIQSTQIPTTQAQLTEAVVETKQAKSPLVVAPEVLGEMERLRRENELLRRSNELLQAAVASPAQAEACANEQLGRFPVDSTARGGKKKSAASPDDILPDTPVKSTARYLDLTRCDSDHDMKQKVSALEGGQIRERTADRHSTESQSANSDRQAQDILEEGSVYTNKKEKAHDDQQKCEVDKRPADEQEILAEHASELSSTATSQGPAPSTPFSGHSTPGGKEHPSPTHPIVTEQEPDHENGVALPEKAQAMELYSPKESVDEHYVNAMTGSDDGDVSDAGMSEADEEEETMDEDDPAPRTSTIDSGNYIEYKVHQEVNFEADEDGLMEEESLESKTAVSNEKVDPALTVSTPVDSKPCETLVINEPDANQQPGTPTNSEILERTTAPSNTDEEEEDGDDEDEVLDRVKRREVIALSSSSSSSESESEDDEASDIPSSNVLEAALRAAGGDSNQKNRTKPMSTANGAVIKKGGIAGGLQNPKSASAVAASTSAPSVPVKSASKKRKAPGFSSTNGKKPPSVKSSILWPALDEFYDFLLDLSPRNVREPEKKRVHLQKYSGEKLPAHHSCIEDYCNVQLEAIMEELVASVSNSTDRRGGGSSGPTRQLSLASVSPCGMQGMSTPSVGLSLGAIFSESGFTGNTCNNNDYILTFDASALGKKASSDFFSGDLVLLHSPRWKNYEMCVFGVVLCDSTVAVGGKSGPGGKGGGGGSGESDQICVLIRAQQRDRDDAVENFSVLTELCLSNQRAPNWRWSMQQVHNTTTSAREFQAIKAISFSPPDLKQVLLRGQLVPSAKTEETLKKSAASSSILSPRLLKYLHKNYNDSQVQAILGCLGENSRVIIQGPPGTGKTKTILGLLSALLDGAGLSTLQKAKGTARIRVGASLQSARTSAVSKTVAETSIRVLVAAPSNAAVDELVVRVLSEGLFDGEKGESYRPRIVRVGRPESSHQLSSLAAAREASESKKNRKKMRKYAREVEEVLLESLVTKHRSTFPTVKQARQAIIKNAQIVFCTLSGAGSVAMCEFAQDFDALIVDEAAQAVEASTLIPFKFRPQRVVLVGDHRQLPATVISKKLVSMGYDRSLQQRLVENGSPVLLLNQQYRMHPEIAEFPSGHFYGGRLVQDDNMREWTAQDYHRDRAFKPLLFLDVQGAQSQVSGSTSLRNMSEVETVVQLVRRLLTKFPRIEWKKRIGVIAPYKQQIYEVRGAIGKLEAEFDRHLGIEVNTVDGFQGREKEIIIYSCVRTSHGGRRKKKRRSHGNDEEDNVLDAFWADERRMNVAITRAKSSLWIVGNSTLLKQSRAWRALIQHTKSQNRYIGDGATTLFASGSSTRKVSKAWSKPGK
ncbi:hypothetical protein PHYPSEUDO_007072 [Phytophthora pseudosyringae]|uniref:Helicase ATP-binding domain-containing protein n=1 Tax=Phytophthora pseudosyringae TaxID=221518 RepID=A0A8T1VM89_9STRA|nr:hypothetical protein PHYPSEUDO_007072 [Phytophthora pseudosyringae]